MGQKFNDYPGFQTKKHLHKHMQHNVSSHTYELSPNENREVLVYEVMSDYKSQLLKAKTFWTKNLLAITVTILSYF